MELMGTSSIRNGYGTSASTLTSVKSCCWWWEYFCSFPDGEEIQRLGRGKKKPPPFDDLLESLARSWWNLLFHGAIASDLSGDPEGEEVLEEEKIASYRDLRWVFTEAALGMIGAYVGRQAQMMAEDSWISSQRISVIMISRERGVFLVRIRRR